MVSDLHLRELERAARLSGSVEDAAALLAARVRAGQLNATRVRLAGALGHAAAARVELGPLPGPRETPTLRREPHPTDYPDSQPLPPGERERRWQFLRAAAPSALPEEWDPNEPWFGPKCMLRNIDEDVFRAAAACGRPALLRVAWAACSDAAEQLFAMEHPPLVSAEELTLCLRVCALAGASLDVPGPNRLSVPLMRGLEQAVETNRARVQNIRLTGPDFGYTTRVLIACYLLADLLGEADPAVELADVRDVVAHAEGYYLELWTPHDRLTALAPLTDEVIARAEARVAGAVRAAVVPWALEVSAP